MNSQNSLDPFLASAKDTSLTQLWEASEKTCQNCVPLTPLTCISECKTWMLKNQFRKLHHKANDPDFTTNLLNTLKNQRRLRILGMISKDHHSANTLQRKLKGLGFIHSQKTIVDEYINPLIETGLADQDQDLYRATLFGCRFNELLVDFQDLANTLPPHSECYEEKLLAMLSKEPKTYDDMKTMVPARSLPRILSRLERALFVETSTDRDYIFFFRTKREPSKSEFSQTEKRVYEGIPSGGISARKLAEKAGISLRRTYKHLRRLKGKKMVFVRRKPISYSLTPKGTRMATMLELLRNLTLEAFATAARVAGDRPTIEGLTVVASAEKKMKDEHIVPLTELQPFTKNDCFLRGNTRSTG
jgi:predicted transcriptional regulator